MAHRWFDPLILIDGSSLKNVTFDLGARITWFDIGGFRSEWRNDIILFSEYGLNSEYYHPFTPLDPLVHCATGYWPITIRFTFTTTTNWFPSIGVPPWVEESMSATSSAGRASCASDTKVGGKTSSGKSETRTSCQLSPAATVPAEFNTSWIASTIQ